MLHSIHVIFLLKINFAFFAAYTKGRRYHVLHFKTCKQLENFIFCDYNRLGFLFSIPKPGTSALQCDFDSAITFKLKTSPFEVRPFNLDASAASIEDAECTGSETALRKRSALNIEMQLRGCVLKCFQHSTRISSERWKFMTV